MRFDTIFYLVLSLNVWSDIFLLLPLDLWSDLLSRIASFDLLLYLYTSYNIPLIRYIHIWFYLFISFCLSIFDLIRSSRSSRIFARSLSLKTVSSFLHNKKKIIVFYYFSRAPTGSEGVNKVRVKIWYKFQDTWVVSIFRYVYGQQKTHTASCKFCQCVSKSTTFWYIIILFILYI